jgi:hypothetical protein
MKQSLVYVLALVLVVAGVGVGSLSGVSGTGGLTSSPSSVANSSQVCISNINGSNPNVLAVRSILQQMSTIPSFIQYSNGRCWTYESAYTLIGPGFSNNTFVFAHFTNVTWYPCGLTYPAFKIDAIIHVVPSFSSNGNVTGVWITSQKNIGTTCPAG